MRHVSSDQIKGARAMLGWTREELADASGLSHNTIRNLEMGFISPRGKTLEQLCQAVEEAGLEFTEDEGIRRLRPDIKIIKGSNSSDEFFDTMLRAAKIKGSEIVGIIRSQNMLLQALGVQNNNDLERVKNLLAHASIRCLFAENTETPLSLSNYQFRMVPKYCNQGTPFFVYGNSFALLQPNCEATFQFVVFNDINLALGNKEHFNTAWDIASPPFIPTAKTIEEHAKA